MAAETMINTEQKKEAEELMGFMGLLNRDEKREFLGIMRGVMLVKGMERTMHPQMPAEEKR